MSRNSFQNDQSVPTKGGPRRMPLPVLPARERADIEAALSRGVVQAPLADAIGPVPEFPVVGRVRAGRREREARLERRHAVELPAADDGVQGGARPWCAGWAASRAACAARRWGAACRRWNCSGSPAAPPPSATSDAYALLPVTSCVQRSLTRVPGQLRAESNLSHTNWSLSVPKRGLSVGVRRTLRNIGCPLASTAIGIRHEITTNR